MRSRFSIIILVFLLLITRESIQSLKDTFADKLPAEIEKIKKLRMYANFCFRSAVRRWQ